jgi:phage terminase large subunit
MQKVVKTNPVYSPYFKDQSRILVIHGGAGSGKSVFVSAKILRRVCEETPHKILVIRKVANTLKDSVYSEFLSRIEEWGLYGHVIVNKTEKSFTFDNSNVIMCKGLDEPEKIKSIEGITSIWIEEATELTEDDFDQLVLRVRGEKKNYVQFILSFNPIDENHWIKKRLVDPGEATVLHTTYKDNLFLDEDYIETLNSLKHTNSLYYQIYCLGEWGVVDTSNKFMYSFDQEKHVKSSAFNPELSVKLSFDFNLEPFAVVVYQTPDKDTINIIDKVRLNNSDIYHVCDFIKAKYPNHFFIVTGDSSGKNRTGTARGKTSYWYIIRQELQLKDAQIRLRSRNLGLIESRVLCNSALQHKNVNIDPEMTELINDCKYAIVDDQGILVKDRKKNANDFLDCFRYAIDIEWPELIRSPKNLKRT